MHIYEGARADDKTSHHSVCLHNCVRLQGIISSNTPYRAKHVPCPSTDLVLSRSICVGVINPSSLSFPNFSPSFWAHPDKISVQEGSRVTESELGSAWAPCCLPQPENFPQRKVLGQKVRGNLQNNPQNFPRHLNFLFSVVKGRWVWCLLSAFPIVVARS